MSGTIPKETFPVFIFKVCGHLQDQNLLSEPDTAEEVNKGRQMNCHSSLVFHKNKHILKIGHLKH